MTRRTGSCAAVLLIALAVLGACNSTLAVRGEATALQRYALMQTLNAELLASRSATATLRDWCARHRLAEVAEIVADAVRSAPVAASAAQRVRLEVSEAEPIGYRQVRLRCGEQLLSVAENWYVPARLTPEMNRQLETTRTPFGQVIAELQPYRRTIAMQVHWMLSIQAVPMDDMPQSLFEHHAVVYSAGHQPLAEVREVYRDSVLPTRH